ncbi:hypothetical protein SAMN05421812_11587 [Asanoa hainanensis]|uniref:RHIM domain-containing protein n=1 Tax=Asanoa hainanensis TaxID=560556 RepID=A0A239P8Y4_9ACTN|nr:hypothetical protein [Asanoa hainanensis]SNT63402.1 hypothetical protein SAMN05421812_11587 [Asanoa hainanensis]
MEGLELIIAALAAGATAGASDVAGAAVRDAYTALRRLLGRKAPEADLDAVDTELAHELERSGAADDPEIIEAARQVLASAEGARMRIGSIEINDSTGVMIGDHGTMTLHIGDHPKKA